MLFVAVSYLHPSVLSRLGFDTYLYIILICLLLLDIVSVPYLYISFLSEATSTVMVSIHKILTDLG